MELKQQDIYDHFANDNLTLDIIEYPMNTEEPLVPSEIFVRPCVNGNSTRTAAIFNFSLISECTNRHNCTLTQEQPGAFFLSPILLGLTGITGQICALTYLHRSHRGKNHKTVFYVMLATLIWTDLIGKLITTPEPIITYAIGHWIGGKPICNLHGYSMSLIGIVTHLLVAIMALERLIGIRNGYFYQRVITTSKTRLLLLGTWVFCLIFCLGPFIGMGEFKLHYPGTWCHLNQHVCADHPLTSRIFHNLYSCINLVCLVVMVSCNLIVVGTLLKMRVTKFKPSSSVQGEKRPTKRLKEREVQMVILLLIITVVFISSWAPHDLLMFKNQLYPPPPNGNPLLDIRAIRMVSINQIIDPWAYIISRIIFRSKLWKGCRKKIFGKMLTRSDSGRYERKSSILSAFSGGSRKNSRASPTHDVNKADFSPDEDFESEGRRLSDAPLPRKKSQVQFHIIEESLPKDVDVTEETSFLKREPLRHRLRRAIPKTFTSLLSWTNPNKHKDKESSSSTLPQESTKELYSQCHQYPMNDYEQMSLLESASATRSKGSLEQRLPRCLSPYLVKDKRRSIAEKGIGVSLMSLQGRSNSWCGDSKNHLGNLYRSHSLETIRKEK